MKVRARFTTFSGIISDSSTVDCDENNEEIEYEVFDRLVHEAAGAGPIAVGDKIELITVD